MNSYPNHLCQRASPPPLAKISLLPRSQNEELGPEVSCPTKLSHSNQRVSSNYVCQIALSVLLANISILPRSQETAEGSEDIIPPKFSQLDQRTSNSPPNITVGGWTAAYLAQKNLLRHQMDQ